MRSLPNEQSNWLKSRYPNIPSTLAQCPTCSGKKTFRWYAPDDRSQVVEYDCPCADQFVMHRVFLYAGIKENYQRLGWADFEQLPDEAAEAALDYIDHAEQYLHAGFGMVLHGPMGTGKTLLGYLLLKRLVAEGHDCYATTFAEMIEVFAGGWRDKDEKAWFNRRVRDASVLFVDDLGRERNKGQGSVGESMLEEVIRHRVGRAMPTLITTNISPADVSDFYGGHTVSLLQERSSTVRFSGEDWRKSRASTRLHEEIRLGVTRPVMVG